VLLSLLQSLVNRERSRKTNRFEYGGVFFILCLIFALAFHSSSGCCWDLFVFWAFCKQRFLLIANDGVLFHAFRIKAFSGWLSRCVDAALEKIYEAFDASLNRLPFSLQRFLFLEGVSGVGFSAV